VARYAETLRQRGVPVMETEFAALPRPDGTCAAYCVQRAVPRESLLTNVLARCGPDEARAHFEFLFEAVVRAISDRVGFDADISNWCVVDGRPFFFDLSTPMLRDEQLREQVDYGLFLPSLPAFVRWFISERTAAAMLAKFYSPRAVALDVLCGLMRERVGRVSAVMLQANRRVAPPITAKELRRYYVVNQSIWALFRKLRRLECWWSLSVRHRSYPYLLPPATAFAGHLAAAQVFRRGLD
jgi:hypothetical protein